MEIEGVESAVADFINQRIALVYENEKALEKAIRLISHFEEVEIIDANAPPKKDYRLKEVISIAISALFFIPAFVLSFLGEAYAWYAFALYLGAFAAAGWSVVWKVIRNFSKILRSGFHLSVLLDENLLMTVAAIGAFSIGQSMEGAVVMLLYQIGELLQSIAVGSSRGAIKKLMALKSDAAIRITEAGQEEIDPEKLQVGDIILIRKGDKVPVDCKLLGATSLDTKSITGEAYLKEVLLGDEALAGCVNEGVAVRAEVVRPSSESAVARILDLVENCAAKKAKPEKFITRFARIYTPAVVLLALLIAVFPPLFDHYNFAVWISRALNFLVVSCPCALIISIPLTYFSGVGALARYGVLAKGAVGLDLLAGVSVVAFDKTGTLTEGRFTVSHVKGGERVLNLAASLEQQSSHPLARAFVGMGSIEVESCEEIAGMGITGLVEGRRINVGSLRYMQTLGIAVEEAASVALTVYVAEEGRCIGCVEVADKLRAEAKDALNTLKAVGITQIAVLTGDTRERAEESLKALPVDEICAQLLPEEKPVRAEKLKERGALLYVGDGINDTPVMAVADVSVAMGGLGSDAAIEASDFVLASDSLSALPKAIKGAKKTKRIVFENIIGSLVLKFALIVLSFFGFIPLWAAVLGDVGVMLLAVLNSMRMHGRIE